MNYHLNTTSAQKETSFIINYLWNAQYLYQEDHKKKAIQKFLMEKKKRNYLLVNHDPIPIVIDILI